MEGDLAAYSRRILSASHGYMLHLCPKSRVELSGRHSRFTHWRFLDSVIPIDPRLSQVQLDSFSCTASHGNEKPGNKPARSNFISAKYPKPYKGFTIQTLQRENTIMLIPKTPILTRNNPSSNPSQPPNLTPKHPSTILSTSPNTPANPFELTPHLCIGAYLLTCGSSTLGHVLLLALPTPGSTLRK